MKNIEMRKIDWIVLFFVGVILPNCAFATTTQMYLYPQTSYTFSATSTFPTFPPTALSTTTLMNWNNANSYCNNLGKRLPKISEFIYNYASVASSTYYGTFQFYRIGDINPYLPAGTPHMYASVASSPSYLVSSQATADTNTGRVICVTDNFITGSASSTQFFLSTSTPELDMATTTLLLSNMPTFNEWLALACVFLFIFSFVFLWPRIFKPTIELIK